MVLTQSQPQSLETSQSKTSAQETSLCLHEQEGERSPGREERERAKDEKESKVGEKEGKKEREREREDENGGKSERGREME